MSLVLVVAVVQRVISAIPLVLAFVIHPEVIAPLLKLRQSQLEVINVSLLD
jgi:hypothetical protein